MIPTHEFCWQRRIKVRVSDMRSSDRLPTSSADALNSSLEYGNEGSSPKQKKSDGGEEYIEDDEMEWRKSAKSALQQQRPPKMYKVGQYF